MTTLCLGDVQLLSDIVSMIGTEATKRKKNRIKRLFLAEFVLFLAGFFFIIIF